MRTKLTRKRVIFEGDLPNAKSKVWAYGFVCVPQEYEGADVVHLNPCDEDDE